MSRVMELEEQIKKLQEEKSKIYSEERKAALSEIKGKIATFQFTAKELGFKPEKAMDGRKARKEDKIAGKKTTKKVAKKAARKPYMSSGMYFDLDGEKIPVKRGKVPPNVKVFAAERGVTTDSLKRNADGMPFEK
jgi:hypothetical protein